MAQTRLRTYTGKLLSRGTGVGAGAGPEGGGAVVLWFYHYSLFFAVFMQLL